jgi:hypothetical protein
MLGEPSFPAHVGVGSDDPHAVASMGRTDVPSSKHAPCSIVPQVGKSSEDGSESASTKHRGVFGKHIRRPNLANNAELLEPKSRTSAFQTCAPPSGGDVLAGEAAGDDVDEAAPWPSVEGADVIPDGERFEVSVALALGEHTLAVSVDFNSTDGSPPEQLGGE